MHGTSRKAHLTAATAPSQNWCQGLPADVALRSELWLQGHCCAPGMSYRYYRYYVRFRLARAGLQLQQGTALEALRRRMWRLLLLLLPQSQHSGTAVHRLHNRGRRTRGGRGPSGARPHRARSMRVFDALVAVARPFGVASLAPRRCRAVVLCRQPGQPVEAVCMTVAIAACRRRAAAAAAPCDASGALQAQGAMRECPGAEAAGAPCFNLLEQAEQLGSLSDAGEVDAEGLHTG